MTLELPTMVWNVRNVSDMTFWNVLPKGEGVFLVPLNNFWVGGSKSVCKLLNSFAF